MFLEQYQTADKHCRLQKGRQTGGYNLLYPHNKAVGKSPRYTEHIHRAYGYLYQQNAAPLQTCEKHLYNGIARHYDNKYRKQRAESDACYHIKNFLHKRFILHNDKSRHIAGHTALHCNCKAVKLDGNYGKKIYRHKAFYDIKRESFGVAAPVLTFNGVFKKRNNYSHSEKRPAYFAEQTDDLIDPWLREQVDAHHIHCREKFSEKVDYFLIQP